MKPLNYLTAVFATLLIVFLLIFVSQLQDKVISLSQKVDALKGSFETYKVNTKKQLSEKDKETAEYKNAVSSLSSQVSKLQKELSEVNDRTSFINRGGDRPEKINMRVTAYDLSYESCQKYKSDPEYGITASGKYVQEWVTVAAGKELKFGTKIYIPFFCDSPCKGWFTVQDRGGAIKRNCIDIFIADHETMDLFGVKKLDVFILKGE